MARAPDDPAGRTLIGAAAAGTTAADAPPPAPPPAGSRGRKFRLRGAEASSEGLRRVADAQLVAAGEALAGRGGGDERGAAVHEARKSIKRVRAVARLSRDAVGEEAYERENADMRRIAARLAGARDARVLGETLAALEQRYEDELPSFATAGLRARLEEAHAHAMTELTEDGAVSAPTRQALEEARARTAQWTFEPDDGFATVKPGLKRIYRQGRKRMRTARAEPTAEHLHDARKRVKDLWHSAQLLHPAHPKRMKRLARDAHALADLLGDHHDLSVLRDYVEEHPQLLEGPAARDALLDVLDRRRKKLQRRALKLGRRVYAKSPKRFVARVQRGWDKRVANG